MGRFTVQLLTVLTVLAVLGAPLAPSPALATEALSPPVAGAPLTRYGAQYETPAGGVTHRGLDLAACDGAVVLAAADGIVTFAGLVPADGGGRATAVTIITPGGLLVTVSPLLTAGVAKGAHVVAGDEVGTLAGTGDASSAQPHIHLSVRVGGTYVDPQPMLGATAPEPAVTAAVAVTAAPGITHRALQRAQDRLRASAGARSASADGAARAAHIAPEMLREQATLASPHLSGPRTAGMGVLLAAAAGLALWGAVDRRAVATARSGH